MTTILQVLLGLALVNYLMLDLIPAPAKPAVPPTQLHKTLLIAGTTLATFVPTLLFSAVLEQLLVIPLASSVLSTLSFCVILAAVSQCIALILVRRTNVNESTLPVFLLLVFGNCLVMGMTMPPRNVELGVVLVGGLARGVGFTLVLMGYTMLRERLAGADMPAMLRDNSTTFLAAALLSVIFMGFAGLA
jgi:Na+-translocating ferredoxin:NAD+ oxidoreductase subunit A